MGGSNGTVAIVRVLFVTLKWFGKFQTFFGVWFVRKIVKYFIFSYNLRSYEEKRDDEDEL
jgi:hypothetical protein